MDVTGWIVALQQLLLDTWRQYQMLWDVALTEVAVQRVQCEKNRQKLLALRR